MQMKSAVLAGGMYDMYYNDYNSTIVFILYVQYWTTSRTRSPKGTASLAKSLTSDLLL